MTCTYNVGGPDGPDRECGREAVCKWVRLVDQSVSVVTCGRHERIVARALGIALPIAKALYRKEDV